MRRLGNAPQHRKRPRNRYVAECKRLLGVLNQRLSSRAWIMGDAYTIADIATFPWARALVGFYEAGDLVGMQDFPHVTWVLVAFVARPAAARGWRYRRGLDCARRECW